MCNGHEKRRRNTERTTFVAYTGEGLYQMI